MARNYSTNLNWLYYIRDYLPSSIYVIIIIQINLGIKVYGFPDSGYFLDY